jgi:hypothetical protein
MIVPAAGGRDNRGRCTHPSTRLYKRPFNRVGASDFHVIELCLTCGRNARGPGRWVPRAEVPNADALPELPQAPPDQPTLFNLEEGLAR